MMLAVLLPGDGAVELIEIDKPAPQRGEVLVRLVWSGICATDLHYADQERDLRRHVNWPSGHEGVGIVEQVGEGVPEERVGERVVCYAFLGCSSCASCGAGDPLHCDDERVLGRTTGGTFAEYVSIPSWCALPLPESLWQPGAAALGCAAPTGFAALDRFVEPHNQVLVTGLGPVGTFTFVFAALSGCSVVAVDPSTQRVAAASRLKLGSVGTSIDNVGLGASKSIDRVVECSGSPDALDTAFRVLSPGGSLIIVGTGAELRVPTRELVDGELSVFGSLFYRPSEWTAMIELLTDSQFGLDAFEGPSFPPERMAEAMAQARMQSWGKVVIGWDTPHKSDRQSNRRQAKSTTGGSE